MLRILGQLRLFQNSTIGGKNTLYLFFDIYTAVKMDSETRSFSRLDYNQAEKKLV